LVEGRLLHLGGRSVSVDGCGSKQHEVRWSRPDQSRGPDGGSYDLPSGDMLL
jgi:hypothetical protein